MKKLLLTLTLLLTLGFAASAQSDPITVSFANTETWTGIKTSGNTETVTATNNGLSFEISNGYWIQSNALFLAKSKGYIVLPAFDAPVTKIEIAGYSGCANAATVTVSGDDLASTTTAKIKGTTVTVNVNSTTSGVQYKIAANSSANAQIATIKIYVEGTPKCAVPAFNVEDNAEVFAGQVISVNKGNATTCELLVNNEPQTGLSYTIPETAEIGTTITLTANSTLEGGDPATATATINVTVIEKPVYVMFDYAGTFSNWTIGTANNIIDTKETATIDGVTMTVEGRHITIEKSTDLRIYRAASGMAAGTITISVPAGFYLTNVVIDGENLSNTDASDNWTNSDETVNSYVITASGSAYIKSIKVYYAKAAPSLVEESTDINITHGKVAGVLTIAYFFEIANHSGNEVVVTATINGKEHITFTKVETPAAAPAREAAENGNWMERGTLTAKHEDLKGAQTLNINVKATLDGNELYNGDHTPRTTTGIEDVTVEGNEAAEYFNLQGIRVAEPQAGQVYIVRRGAKTTKELVK